MTSLLAVTSDGNDGCAYYRATGPFAHMKKFGGLQVTYDNNPSFGTIRAADWIFFLRPCTDGQLKLIELAKDLGVKVWVDYDDNLFCVPNDNPSHEFYSRGNVQSNMSKAIQLADAVTVSTKELATALSVKSKAISIVPNAYDPIWSILQDGNIGQQNCVLWRGTGTHNRDVSSVAAQLIAVAKKRAEVASWCFVGANPWFVTDHLQNAVHFQPLSPITTYFKTIFALRPKLFIAPLADSPFNRAKSSIAAIEAIAAGSICVAREWFEWERCPNVVTYSSDDKFGEAVEKALDLSASEREFMIKAATQEGIDGTLSLAHANTIRWKAIST